MVLHGWQRYHSWPSPERRLFRFCLMRLLMVRLRLWLRGFQATRRYYQSEPLTAATDRSAWLPEALAVDRMVRRAARLLPGSRCLARALTVWSLLRQDGVDAQLYIGVQRSSASFNAHAWVELAGQPLGERVEQYAVFAVPIDPT